MPLQIDILVVNCSVFSPTPSLSAAVVNHFRLKPTVITYNLSGMGCSAGLLSIALVRDLLQVRPAPHHGYLPLLYQDITGLPHSHEDEALSIRDMTLKTLCEC